MYIIATESLELSYVRQFNFIYHTYSILLTLIALKVKTHNGVKIFGLTFYLDVKKSYMVCIT